MPERKQSACVQLLTSGKSEVVGVLKLCASRNIATSLHSMPALRNPWLRLLQLQYLSCAVCLVAPLRLGGEV